MQNPSIITFSVKLTPFDIVCISRQFSIGSSENKLVFIDRLLVAFVKFHAGRAAILVELADSIHLVALAVSDSLHDLGCRLAVRHRECFGFEGANGVIVISRVVQHVRLPRELLRLVQSVHLPRLSVSSVSFLLDFVSSLRLRIALVIDLDLGASLGIKALAVVISSILLHCFAGIEYITSLVQVGDLRG